MSHSTPLRLLHSVQSAKTIDRRLQDLLTESCALHGQQLRLEKVLEEVEEFNPLNPKGLRSVNAHPEFGLFLPQQRDPLFASAFFLELSSLQHVASKHVERVWLAVAAFS